MSHRIKHLLHSFTKMTTCTVTVVVAAVVAGAVVAADAVVVVIVHFNAQKIWLHLPRFGRARIRLLA